MMIIYDGGQYNSSKNFYFNEKYFLMLSAVFNRVMDAFLQQK